MRMIAAVIGVAGALVANAALAQTSTNATAQACRAEAHRQVLSGEALVSFMASCTSGQVTPTRVSTDATQRCADQARMLSGEAKVQALRDCR